MPVVTLQIDEDNEFDPLSPCCQMVLSSSALLSHPKVQTTSSPYSSRTSFMLPKPCLDAHAYSYYNMLHSVTPAKSTGILKWDTSLKCLHYVTEQMILEKKLCSRRQLSNKVCCCQAKWQNKVVLFQYQREAYAWVGGEQNNKVTEFWIFEFEPLLLHLHWRAKFPNTN